MSFEKELKQLVGKKIVSSERMSVTFEDGSSMDLHPYETYIYLSDVELVEEQDEIKLEDLLLQITPENKHEEVDFGVQGRELA